MTLPRPTQLAHTILRDSIRPGDTVIDATAGNGHDSVFLTECVGPGGRVLAFDLQERAIRSAQKRVETSGHLSRVEFFQINHLKMGNHAGAGTVAVVMFNLGYLPGEDHALTTEATETQAALEVAMDLLKPGGLLSVVCYPGHPEGATEATDAEDSLASKCAAGWSIAKYAMLGTKRPAPFLLIARKP